MRKLSALVAVIVFCSLLVGCSSRVDSAAKREEPATKRPLEVGESVTLRNGLTLTVPEGWDATLTIDPAPEGPLHQDEYVLLENFDAVERPSVLMVMSSTAATIPPAALNEYGRDKFRLFNGVGDLDLYVGRPGTPYEPKRLWSAVTHLPNSSLGVMYFAADADDPSDTLRTIWDLFKIQGTPVPELDAAG